VAPSHLQWPPLQGSDGSKDRQLEALHSERQALQQDNSALHRQAQGLQVCRLGQRGVSLAGAEGRNPARALQHYKQLAPVWTSA
jgi:hypothetical protein